MRHIRRTTAVNATATEAQKRLAKCATQNTWVLLVLTDIPRNDWNLILKKNKENCGACTLSRNLIQKCIHTTSQSIDRNHKESLQIRLSIIERKNKELTKMYYETVLYLSRLHWLDTVKCPAWSTNVIFRSLSYIKISNAASNNVECLDLLMTSILNSYIQNNKMEWISKIVY